MDIKNKERQRRRRLDLARRFLAAGVPLEINEDAAEDLLIRQIDGLLETCAFDLSYGAAGYVISLCVTVNRPVLGILKFDLELPWMDTTIQWLKDPRDTESCSTRYRFPGEHALELERDLVINHFADLKRKFHRGDFFQGFLLGVGSQPIPDDIRHGLCVPSFVTITDQYYYRYSSPIELFIDRTQKSSNPRPRKPVRKRLFDERDPEDVTAARSRSR